jgi:Na+-transporting NADH:ubiquinone oxidoreductase subunit D
MYELDKALSVYIGLIITNCIVMGRLEAFALGNKPLPALLDGIGNGLGYGLILVIVAFIRELFGTGQLMGFQVIPEGFYNIGYENCGFMLNPPMALILIGVVIWIQRSKMKELQEK